MVVAEVGVRPLSRRVSLSQRRRLLVPRLRAAQHHKVVRLAPRAVVPLLVGLVVVRLAPLVVVPLLVGLRRRVALWGPGSPPGSRSRRSAWVRSGARPSSPLVPRGPLRCPRLMLRGRLVPRTAGATQMGAGLVVSRPVVVGVVSQRERERCIGDERCCSGAGEDGGTYLRRVA